MAPTQSATISTSWMLLGDNSMLALQARHGMARVKGHCMNACTHESIKRVDRLHHAEDQGGAHYAYTSVPPFDQMYQSFTGTNKKDMVMWCVLQRPVLQELNVQTGVCWQHFVSHGQALTVRMHAGWR